MLSLSPVGYRMLYCVFLEMDKDESIHEDRKSNIVKQKILMLSTLLFVPVQLWEQQAEDLKMVYNIFTYVMFNPKQKRSVSYNSSEN